MRWGVKYEPVGLGWTWGKCQSWTFSCMPPVRMVLVCCAVDPREATSPISPYSYFNRNCMPCPPSAVMLRSDVCISTAHRMLTITHGYGVTRES